jgi:hypothetical protein
MKFPNFSLSLFEQEFLIYEGSAEKQMQEEE